MSDDNFDGWVVYVPQGSFTSVYGIFRDHDEAICWRRANGYDAETAHPHPIRRVEADHSESEKDPHVSDSGERGIA